VTTPDTGGSCLLDTNILLRLVQRDSLDYQTIRQSVELLVDRGTELFYTSQNLAEFWNVCTRPAERNGFGFSITETNERATLIESKFSLAPDSEITHREWRRIVVSVGVSGVQVHDARLVAAMYVHRIGTLLTLNATDFRRYTNVTVISPSQVLAT